MYNDIAFDPLIITYGLFLKLYSYNPQSPFPCPSPFMFQWMTNERFSEKKKNKHVNHHWISPINTDTQHSAYILWSIRTTGSISQIYSVYYCMSISGSLSFIFSLWQCCDLRWHTAQCVIYHLEWVARQQRAALLYWPSSIHQQPNRQWPSLML